MAGELQLPSSEINHAKKTILKLMERRQSSFNDEFDTTISIIKISFPLAINICPHGPQMADGHTRPWNEMPLTFLLSLVLSTLKSRCGQHGSDSTRHLSGGNSHAAEAAL
jgi:hypothetical protein